MATETRDRYKLIDDIQEYLVEVDNEELERLYNQLFTSQVSYTENDEFEIEIVED